ncbi:uncharacterized protein LOC127248357 isoform X2 [Andrographis paniculata]|uniref:uncharacterized protein LOC127248357 isoform X2 n=1 Tax=Andrographis paniculata TaxID=175694 RepID=UPI0021E7A718|nr:uncharacterized protein LOC127248357 isoform X2 [Andrographis paniculata]
MAESPDTDLVQSLQLQMQSLSRRIQELEAENARLSVRLSNCDCRKVVENDETGGTIEEMEALQVDDRGLVNRSIAEVSGNDRNDKLSLSHLPKRHIALKVMYFGQRYYGFASEAQNYPTIESEIFKALQKTRLILGDKMELNYSRCGRTDKGVSSVGQVISLFLRSDHREIPRINGCSEETVIHESYGGELDYVKLLNRVLPKDIRVIGWSPAPTDFSARFSCLSREYKYFFWRENLDILVMETAGKKFIGEHDFRNFCKMDAANVHNYRRHIISFEMFPCNERFEDDQLWAVKIKGSAFLWHQIRCMVAVLFLIGQGLESPNVIDELLDVDKTPRKPQYTMAPETPLVLHSCEFEGLKFMCSSDARKALCTHFNKECRDYKLQAAIFDEALQSSSCSFYESCKHNSRIKRKGLVHIPLMSRPTEPSYEERRAKLTVHE